MSNYFDALNAIDVSAKVEKKNGLAYLSWPWAWGELKKRHPTATYTVYENGDGLNYHHDGRTAYVKTGVTVDGIEHIESLPVMDFRNASIPVDKLTSFDVNKAIQRSLTKAIARHGLGLYIYAGEDLPERDKSAKSTTVQKAQIQCANCGNMIFAVAKKGSQGELLMPDDIAKFSQDKFGRVLCPDCQRMVVSAAKDAGVAP